MKREILNTNFNTAIRKKIPNKSQLTTILTEILMIEKEAVYRRLRGEVPFSFTEVGMIAEQLCISLDELIGIKSEKKRPFTLQLSEFETPGKVDYLMWKNYNQILRIFKKHSSFVISETWRTIPFPLCYNFPLLTQFYIFKWGHQTHNHVPIKVFENIELEEDFLKLGRESFDLFNYAETHYILSDTLFLNLVKDILFFKNIHLINEDSLQALFKEMEKCIDYLEELAIKGEYKETGKKIHIYITEIEIDTDYSLIEGNNNYISMLRALVMNSAATTDDVTFHQLKKWFTALKRLSIQISVSGEKERIRFFKKQREAIHALK